MQDKKITKKNTKRVAIVGGTVAALLTGGVAYAYWTTSGNGSGSATTGTSSAFVVTTDAATGGPLTPGGADNETVAFHVKNTNSGVQRLQTVTVTVANADGSAWVSAPGCSAADFTIGNPAFTPGDIESGNTADGTVTISMKNLTTSQNGCKGVTVPLYVVAG